MREFGAMGGDLAVECVFDISGLTEKLGSLSIQRLSGCPVS
jgi:hypothetical protein